MPYWAGACQSRCRRRTRPRPLGWLYARPHMSIGNKKPMDVYNGEVPGKNLWKKTEENFDSKDLFTNFVPPKKRWTKVLCRCNHLKSDGTLSPTKLCRRKGGLRFCPVFSCVVKFFRKQRQLMTSFSVRRKKC